MMSTYSRCVLPSAAIVCVLQSAATAILVSDDNGVPAQALKVDFSQYAAAGRIALNTGDSPIVIDDLPNETVLLRPISGASTVALLLGDHTPPSHPDNNYYLGQNGHWGPDRLGFLGIGGGNGTRVVARIEFADGPVSFVGGLFNYPPNFPEYFPIIMTALGQNESVLESHVIDAEAPIATPGEIDVGEFRGIQRDLNEIFSLEFSAPFAVIDDVRFLRVPEPAANLLALTTVMLLRRNLRMTKAP